MDEFEVYEITDTGEEEYFAGSSDQKNIMYYAGQLERYTVYKVTREIIDQTT